jgi:MscS family membrane protein
MITGLSILDQALWGNSVATYLLFIIYIVLGLIFIKLISLVFNKLFKKQEEKISKYEILFNILRNPEPILFIIFVAILRSSARVFYTSTTLAIIISKLVFALYVLFAAWFVIKTLIAIIERYLGKYADAVEDIKRFDYLKPLIKTLIRIFIFVIAALLIVSNLGFNISGLIAGLGIGGIAVAFASRELLENFFSGLIIYTERPLKVGDTVKADDFQIFGDVLEIGVRTTKIKSFDGTIHTVPNSILSGKTLENVSVMPARRIVSVLSLSSKSTSEQIEKSKKIIASIFEAKKKKKELMEEHHIFFDKFTSSSMDITYIYWINKEIDYWEQMDVKDSINTEIKKELDKAKIELANFPK